MWRSIGQTLLGVLLAATPVVIWVAWSPRMLVGTLVASLVCGGLLVLLTEAHPEGTSTDGVRLSEEFMEEVQSLHPMIYHHSGRRSSRFQRAMRRLARLTPPGRG